VCGGTRPPRLPLPGTNTYVLEQLREWGASVVEHPPSHWPRWITNGPGGDGFMEMAERIIAALWP